MWHLHIYNNIYKDNPYPNTQAVLGHLNVWSWREPKLICSNRQTKEHHKIDWCPIQSRVKLKTTLLISSVLSQCWTLNLQHCSHTPVVSGGLVLGHQTDHLEMSEALPRNHPLRLNYWLIQTTIHTGKSNRPFLTAGTTIQGIYRSWNILRITTHLIPPLLDITQVPVKFWCHKTKYLTPQWKSDCCMCQKFKRLGLAIRCIGLNT